MAGVLIVAEAVSGALAPSTLELAGEGRRVAEALGEPLIAAIAGTNVRGNEAALGEAGVEQVYLADHSGPGVPSPEWTAAAVVAAVKQAQPSVVLISHSAAGRMLAPTLAARVQSGVVTDATRLRVEGDRVIVTKPVFGGSVLSEQVVLANPQVVTLRARSFAAAEPQPRNAAQSIALQVPEAAGGLEVLEEIREESTSGPKLKDAKVVVSGGRGLGGAENWHAVEELAAVLGGAVGASRAVTDAGWISPSHQVGLTGATVAPDLYIAIGISGAVQHVAGISGARNVVAINKDAEANIFKYARFGVVGDWKQVVPALTERLKQLRS
ncbi:MAG: electron transfer flavoprotein subunit alpha/FixB family protein [Chloroflexi bacterium]|nr:electron transfer flavoprotein subunit alpha/FixB family protein [Chloroflexota bacterium]